MNTLNFLDYLFKTKENKVIKLYNILHLFTIFKCNSNITFIITFCNAYLNIFEYFSH